MNKQNDDCAVQARKKIPLRRHPLTLAIAAGVPWFLATTIVDYWRNREPNWVVAISGCLLLAVFSYVIADWRNHRLAS